MLQNAYFLAKIGADTAENEQHCHFAEILPKTGNYPTGPPSVGPKSAESGSGRRQRGARGEARHDSPAAGLGQKLLPVAEKTAHIN